MAWPKPNNKQVVTTVVGGVALIVASFITNKFLVMWQLPETVSQVAAATQKQGEGADKRYGEIMTAVDEIRNKQTAIQMAQSRQGQEITDMGHAVTEQGRTIGDIYRMLGGRRIGDSRTAGTP